MGCCAARYPNAEPTVWTGLSDEFDPATGDVKVGYHTSYQTTGAHGGDRELIPMLTSTYTFGTVLLMAGGPETPQCFGPDSHDGHGSCMVEPGAGLPNLTGDPSPCVWGVERRGEISPLGSLAGCFLAVGSGLGLVGTVSARR